MLETKATVSHILVRPHSVSHKEETIGSKFAVGLLAVATLTVAALLRRQRSHMAIEREEGRPINLDDLYAAGL
ncbi:MAG: hypothetical protein OEZ54_01705 [Gemmatimonadota bacterium]|nr:hypothetical protein [Gemmatimonadota bacterium]